MELGTETDGGNTPLGIRRHVAFKMCDIIFMLFALFRYPSQKSSILSTEGY